MPLIQHQDWIAFTMYAFKYFTDVSIAEKVRFPYMV